MNNHTAAALHEAAYNLRAEAKRSERSAANHREQAEAYEGKARGLRDAADVIDAALAEEP